MGERVMDVREARLQAGLLIDDMERRQIDASVEPESYVRD